MKVVVTDETYKPTTGLFAAPPEKLTELVAYRNSHGAFQVLLHDGKCNHYLLDTQFSIPDSIETPIYRLAIDSQLPVKAQFLDYYIGAEELEFADKLMETSAQTYAGDRWAPVYVEVPIASDCPVGVYPVKIRVYREGLTSKDQLIYEEEIAIAVKEFVFPAEPAIGFNLDIWQQPSNLARTFQVPLWSEQHFQLIAKMAASLARLGQKAVTVIAGEIPWKGWFNYIVKDYPANLYEYSMIRVVKTEQNQIRCDFSILEKYLHCFFEAGIHQEIDLFGLLGVWQPPFFPLNKAVEHPEKLVIRYQEESSGKMGFLTAKEDLVAYLRQVVGYFKEKGLWAKVRIFADEPKAHEIEQFKHSVAALKAVEPSLQVKVAFDKEPVLQALLSEIDYPVTSYYCTCQHGQQLNEQFSGKTQYYICNYPDKPNTFLHSPLVESRIQGILAHYFKTDGLLRWAYNCWPENARYDIRYNTASLPIGDLCLIYPSVSGNLLLSLRYKQLYRGIEDFALIKWAQQIDKEATQQLLTDFLGESDPAQWMLDSHRARPELFNQDYQAYETLRAELIAMIMNANETII